MHTIYTEGQNVALRDGRLGRVPTTTSTEDYARIPVTAINSENLKLEKALVSPRDIRVPTPDQARTTNELFELKAQKAHSLLQRHGMAVTREEAARAVLKYGEASPRNYAAQIDASRIVALREKTGKHIDRGTLSQSLAAWGFQKKPVKVAR